MPHVEGQRKLSQMSSKGKGFLRRERSDKRRCSKPAHIGASGEKDLSPELKPSDPVGGWVLGKLLVTGRPGATYHCIFSLQPG
jgi:hypothetical protein